MLMKWNWLSGVKSLAIVYATLFSPALAAEMFPCQVCGHNCATILAYVRHMRIHKNTPNLIFKCVLPDCSRTFQNFSTFKCHTYRHKDKCVVRPRLCGVVELTCHIDFCSAMCEPFTLIWKYKSEKGKQRLVLIDTVTRDLQFYPHSLHTWAGNIK